MDTLRDTLRDAALALLCVSPVLVAGGYWLATGRSVLSLFGW